MKILIIADEEWNDYVYGNNVLTNWFSNFDAEFAEIYTSPGLPINNICNRYFQITDVQMVKSIICGKPAGKVVFQEKNKELLEYHKQNAQRKGIYGIFKKISLWCHTPVIILRDLIWLNGKYNKEALKQFILDFNPDLVFCPRLITPKLMRLEKLVSTITSAPFIAFTGDSEVEMTNNKLYTLSGIRRWCIHHKFTTHVKLYSQYLMHSLDQAKEYNKEYGIKTSTLFKCGEFPDSFVYKQVGTPIRLVYAGRLYCNRWVSLAEIGKALQEINKDGVKMILDIYTQEKLTSAQIKNLSEERFIYVKGNVSPTQLKQIYANADIALHVESMDKYYRAVTRVSFSTKIIDLMASTCAILAICWDKHCGYQYLKENDAAFCVSNYREILPMLQQICNNPTLITEYAHKAYNCGIKNHNCQKVRQDLFEIFQQTVKQSTK